MTLPAPLELGWRAVPGISFLRDGPTGVRVGTGEAPPLALQLPSPALADALAHIRSGVAEADLCARLDPTELARFHYTVERLVAAGLVALDILHRGRRLATLIPRRRDFALPTRNPVAGAELTLSRFAYLRRIDAELVLAAPDATCEVVLIDRHARAWVADCVHPQRLDGITEVERSAFLQLLHGIGLLELDGTVESDATRTWEFHDRLFHRAARSYDDHIVRGGTNRFRGMLASPPAVRDAYRGPVRTLQRPTHRGAALSLATVMEVRRSTRAMAGEPVSIEDVGELLFRVARTSEMSDGADPLIRRPYPSGGARHELEFYLAVGSCRDLEPGFYHYRGNEHTLVDLGAPEASRAMLDDCASAWGQPNLPPQVLVTISSRLPRLAWKYQRIAYKMSLLNAGAVIANLYLVATDMGLAGSAAGSGNPELFAAATGADSWAETSIAEFGFGRAGD